MSSVGAVRDTIKSWTAPVMRYERHLSAAGMVAGFIIDNYTFGRIDRPRAHLIFGGYLVIAAATIAFSHALQTRADRIEKRRLAMAQPATTSADAFPSASEPSADAPATTLPQTETAATTRVAEPQQSARWRTWLPAATQFALGGLWSGFLVFYSRSASLAASWLFLATLGSFLIGNEVFRKYHSRLVFSSLLFFFATYSYAIFVVPLLTRNVGRITFLASGVVATLVFAIFLQVLAKVGIERYRQSRLRLIAGAGAIVAAMNAFYFTGILPPLPLALLRVGIFHSVKRVEGKYVGTFEGQPWYTQYALSVPTVHIVKGEPLSLYSAVFAPVQLGTRISHVWQRYDERRSRWVTRSTVTFLISGGRDDGYRAYTVKRLPQPGEWRVNIETDDGRLIGRLRFNVETVAAPIDLKPKVIP